MALYSSLTVDQKATLAIEDRQVRAAFVQLMRLANAVNLPVWQAWGAANVDPIMAALDGTETIPNSTDFGGAVSMTATEFGQLRVILKSLASTAASAMPLIAKAIGVNAN